MTHSLTPVSPTLPVAAYIGGKRNLSKRICARLETIPHTTYAEVFVGMGGIFFRRKAMPRNEIINDLSRDVANLFRILQRHYPQFMDTLRFQISSRAEFDRLVRVDPDTLTDLERAARFLYLQRTAFGGRVASRNFGMVKDGRGARFNLTKLEPMLQDVHERLSGVSIECLPYARLISAYDRKNTLFYLDPPYFGNEDDYGADMFSRDDFAALADQLAAIKGRFVMSINDTPEIRALFAAFDIEPVKLTYSLNAKGPTNARELIISN